MPCLNFLTFLYMSYFRSTLTGRHRIEFVHAATSGLRQYNFKCTYNRKTELDNVYSLALRVRQFREDCCRYDMHDVFDIIPFLDDGVLDMDTKPKSLFDNHKDISLENVRKSTRMYNEHSSADYIVENIAWSGEKLLHSCEAELRDMILSKALFLPQKEIGGPVYFKIMMDICNETNISPTSSPRSSKPKRLELQGLNTRLSLSNLST